MSDHERQPATSDIWVEERMRDVYATRFRVKRVLFSGKSPFQHVDVLETAGHGRMLLNDGLVMITEKDEFIYHEMIAHVPLFLHHEPQRVLVIGGGDGGTVREVLRHPSVEHVHLVEIDDMVVQACREFIPQTAACLDDRRVQVTIADGVRFVAETSERFDVVLVDSTDPFGPATPLFGADFYTNVRQVLEPGGIVVSQAENPHFDAGAQRALLQTLRSIFPVVALYNYANLTYPGALWSFSYASLGPRPLTDFGPHRVTGAELDLRWYNADVHRAAFALPEFQRRDLAEFMTSL